MSVSDDLRALAEAATPGPWKARNGAGEVDFYGWPVGWEITGLDRYGFFEGDAKFIAAANPVEVIELLDTIVRLRAELDAARPLAAIGQAVMDEPYVPSTRRELINEWDGTRYEETLTLMYSAASVNAILARLAAVGGMSPRPDNDAVMMPLNDSVIGHGNGTAADPGQVLE